MKKKIVIIGAGIFGCTIYLKLHKKYDCIIVEKNKQILNGASTNNLNRVHLGYHYPRDDLTAQQSYNGIKSFIKLYKDSILKNFENYYLISKNSRVNFTKYIKFLKKHNLEFKVIKNNEFKFNNKNIEGIIKVKEPIYDWKKVKQFLNSRINKEKIYFNSEVVKVKKIKNLYKIIMKNNNQITTDIVIDSTHWSTNTIFGNSKLKKLIYQITSVYEITILNTKKIGLAVMDGNFFSILPKGFEKNHLLYDVKYSILKVKNKYKINNDFMNLDYGILKKLAKKNIPKIKKKIKKYLINFDFKFTNQFYFAVRVILPDCKKTDRRQSKIVQIKKNYFQIFSAKVDHSVDIANQMRRALLKN